MACNKLSTFVLFICAVGAINWGLVGVLEFNLVNWLSTTLNFAILEKIVYVFVGIAGLFGLFESISCTFSK